MVWVCGEWFYGFWGVFWGLEMFVVGVLLGVFYMVVGLVFGFLWDWNLGFSRFRMVLEIV